MDNNIKFIRLYIYRYSPPGINDVYTYLSNKEVDYLHCGDGDSKIKMTPPEVFYAISADNLKAIPFGLVHIGVINTTDPSYRTIEIKHNYDPYEKGTTFNFLAWTQPVPFSVPLFAHESKSDKGLYITFDGEPPLESSPLESSPQEWDKDQFPR